MGSNVTTVNLTEIDTTASSLKRHYLIKNTCFSSSFLSFQAWLRGGTTHHPQHGRQPHSPPKALHLPRSAHWRFTEIHQTPHENVLRGASPPPTRTCCDAHTGGLLKFIKLRPTPPTTILIKSLVKTYILSVHLTRHVCQIQSS